MGIAQNHTVDTLLLPPNTTLVEMNSYANAIGATIEYQNQHLYLKTHNGGMINIIVTTNRPHMH